MPSSRYQPAYPPMSTTGAFVRDTVGGLGEVQLLLELPDLVVLLAGRARPPGPGVSVITADTPMSLPMCRFLSSACRAKSRGQPDDQAREGLGGQRVQPPRLRYLA